MKIQKRLSCLFLALALALGVLVVPAVPAQAASKAQVPAIVRISPDSHVNHGIEITYASGGDKIKNIKSSSKALIAKQTSHSEASGNYGGDSDYYRSASIGLYSKKTGTYTVKFDIYSKDGKTRKSQHSVKVYVKNYDNAFKSVNFDGKDIYKSRYTTKKSGKLSVKMTKGYTLKKIEVITYGASGKESVKTVKNNQKITLGKYPYQYKDGYTSSYDPEQSYSRWEKDMFSGTQVRITYKDKYTKKNVVSSYTIYRTK